jgi:superfamily I DNA and/or RNA helicase
LLKDLPLVAGVVDYRYAGWSSEVNLNTVDAFQGQEQDVVILSTVRAAAVRRLTIIMGLVFSF